MRTSSPTSMRPKKKARPRIESLPRRVGDHAHQCTANISVIDTDSYWIDGYFEETKMARICVGDRVREAYMGCSQPILERVATVTRGMGVSDAAACVQGLPKVDPVYTWVTLAQRVPIRIAIDSVPPGIPLVSGMTATVTVKDAISTEGRTWFSHVIPAVEARLSDVMNGPPTWPGCIPAMTAERATTESLPLPEEKKPPSPEQLNPGLAPSMDASPKNH